jgi:hypothetical protein
VKMVGTMGGWDSKGKGSDPTQFLKVPCE